MVMKVALLKHAQVCISAPVGQQSVSLTLQAEWLQSEKLSTRVPYYPAIWCCALRPFLGAMLQAGYNLDCLMLRYEGVDWQDRSKWRCGAMIAPHQEGTYDGTSLNPLEVRHEYSRLDYGVEGCNFDALPFHMIMCPSRLP